MDTLDPTNRVLSLPREFRPAYQARLAASSRVDVSGCILWTGPKDRHGYGRFKLRSGRRTGAHRLAWILARGPIPDPTLVLDHLCRVPACVNPAHLELVTNAENTRRGDITLGGPRPGARGARGEQDPDRPTCRNGHSWQEHGTAYIDRNGWRQQYCRECNREAKRRARRVKANAPARVDRGVPQPDRMRGSGPDTLPRTDSGPGGAADTLANGSSGTVLSTDQSPTRVDSDPGR